MAKTFLAVIFIAVAILELGFRCDAQDDDGELEKKLGGYAKLIKDLLDDDKPDDAASKLEYIVYILVTDPDIEVEDIKETLKNMLEKGQGSEIFVILTIIEGKICPSKADQAIGSLEYWSTKNKTWKKFVHLMKKYLEDSGVNNL